MRHWTDLAAFGAGFALYWVVVGMSDASGINNHEEKFCLWHPVIAGAVTGLVIAATACLRADKSA